jgi:WD40 repeat protein
LQVKTGKLTPGADVPGATVIGRPDCSSDGKILVTGDVGAGGGTARFRDVQKGEVLQTIPGHRDQDPDVVWSPEGRRILRKYGAYPAARTYLWDLGEKDSPTRSLLPGSPLAWSPDGQKVALQAGSDLRIVEASTGKELQALRGHTTTDPNLAEWSPDGRLLASSSRDGTVRVWDTESGKNLHTWDGYRVGNWIYLAWSPDSKRLASGSDWDKTTRIRDVSTGKVVASLPVGPGSHLPMSGFGGKILLWSSDGQKLALGGEKLRLWDVASGQLDDTYDTPGWVGPIAWLADGSIVAVTNEDRTLRVWTSAGRLGRTVKLPAIGVLSPDRRLLASLGGSATWIWDVETSRCRGTLLQLLNDRYLVISPDGHYTGSPRAERELVYVVETDQGQETLTPEEFAQRYGWKSDPARVRLLER